MALADNQVTVEQLCQRLTAYQPRADVDYKPGKDVDAHGKPIIPADVDGTPKLDLPDTIDVAITFDQAKQFGLPVTTPYTPQSYIGNVSVTKDGDTYFNGKRISDTQVQALCKDKDKSSPDATKPVAPVSYGTKPKDDLSSLHR
jgi:hypothetical protein